jgi:hypothetical protein
LFANQLAPWFILISPKNVAPLKSKRQKSNWIVRKKGIIFKAKPEAGKFAWRDF